MQAPSDNPNASASRRLIQVATVLLVLVACAVWIGRWRLAPMPLDRDEGEYAYMGQLLLQGVPPYARAYNMKLPGTSTAYAALMSLFGQTAAGIRYGFLLVNAVTAGFLFLIGRRLLDPTCGLLAAACFLVLSFTRQVHGMSANAEHFVLLCAVPGLWLVLRHADLERARDLALGGLLLGSGVLMKQHGLLLAAAGGASLLFHELGRRPLRWSTAAARWALFGGCVLAPALLALVALILAGVFDNFKLWVIEYARTYGAQASWADAGPRLAMVGRRVFLGAPLPWVLAGAGLAAVGLAPALRRRIAFLGAWVASAVAAVGVGLYFRPHYFVFLLPPAALLFGAATAVALRRVARQRLPGAAAALLGVAAVGLGLTVWQQRALWYGTDPEAASRKVFSGNPFTEAPVFARYIRDHSAPEDTVAVIGSEPEIPFYAGRRSATGYIYMYPLMEDQPYARQMQRAAIAEIEAAEPRYAVYVVNQLSWLIQPESSIHILEWFDRYRQEHYGVVGLAFFTVDESGGFSASQFFWGAQAKELARQVWPVQREVFERRRPPVIILLERVR